MVDRKTYARASERLPVSPREIKGSVVNAEGEADQVALVWNISVQGLCLWVSHKHKQGEKVTLKVSVPWKGEVECFVRWSRLIPDRSGFLIGLEAVDGNDALKALHSRLTKTVKKAG